MKRALVSAAAIVVSLTALSGTAQALPVDVGAPTLSPFPTPNALADVAYDADGALWVLGEVAGQEFIAQVNASGAIVETVDISIPEDAGFATGLDIGPDGNFYVAYVGNGTPNTGAGVSVYSPTGEMLSTLTLGGCELGWPGFLDVSPAGTVYVPDSSTENTVLVFNSSGTCVDTITGEVFDSPTGVALDSSGNAYVSMENSGSVAVINPQGDVTDTWTIPQGVGLVAGIAVDAFDTVYVSTQLGDGNISVWTTSGTQVGSLTTSLAQTLDVFIDKPSSQALLAITPYTGSVSTYELLFPITVSVTGDGTGGVTGSGGLACGFPVSDAWCTGAAPLGAAQLTTWIEEGSVFDGWAGACTGSGPCTVNIGYDGVTAIAQFGTARTPGRVGGLTSELTGARGDSLGDGSVDRPGVNRMRSAHPLHIVRWHPPRKHGGAPVTHYEVRFKTGKSPWTSWKQAEDTRAQRACPRAHRTCTVEVRAVNVVGAGPERRLQSAHVR